MMPMSVPTVNVNTVSVFLRSVFLLEILWVLTWGLSYSLEFKLAIQQKIKFYFCTLNHQH